MRYLPVIAFLSITFFSASFLFSQEPVTICGSVIDKSNGLPLPYAQVSRVNSAMGTCSNEEGKFCLYIPAAGRNDSVLFSFLGYEMRKIAAKDLAGKDSAIEMTPRILQLSEVVITSLTPEEVILRAVAAIPENYGEDSTVLTAFVRNRKVINNRLAEYTEAILEDLKTGYMASGNKARKSKLKDSNIANLVKGRVVADTNMVNALGDAGKSVGCLGCLFMNDFVEYPWNTVLDEDLFRYYHFRMEEISDTAGSKIYHIFYDQKKGVDQTLWKGEIYIEASSYAVMKFAQKPSMEAFSAYEKKKFRKTYVLKDKPGWIAEMPHISLTVTYAERNGKWTLNTVQNDNWILFMDPATGEKIRVNAKSEVVVTDVSGDSERLSKFKGVSKSTDLKRWDQYVSEPDNAFWATYNYLPVEAKLKASLERLGSD